MSQLKPVPSDYQPQYPRELTREQIHELLRPGLFKRFSQQTLAAGALIAGMTAVGCQPGASAEAEAQESEPITDVSYPKPPSANTKGSTTSSDPNLKKKVDAIVAEVLAQSKKGVWYESSSIRLQKELKANPPIKYPLIPVMFGNSYVGIFDHETAREATFRLFKAYGIELKKDVPIKGEGYGFSADGYNTEQKVGFELVMRGQSVLVDGVFKQKPDPERLEDGEKEFLSKDVAEQTLNVFVVDASGFPNAGDLYTPMEYYLGTVVDYLNWLHGDKKIDPEKLLGKYPGVLKRFNEQVSDWQKSYVTLPGCDFESAEDLKLWSAQKGIVRLDSRFSGNLISALRFGNNSALTSSSKGKNSLNLDLQEGGKAIYTVPEGTTIRLKRENIAFACRACFDSRLMPEPKKPLRLKIVLQGEDGKTWEIEHTVEFISTIISKRKQAPFDVLKTIEISVKDGTPAKFYLDDLGLSRD